MTAPPGLVRPATAHLNWAAEVVALLMVVPQEVSSSRAAIPPPMGEAAANAIDQGWKTVVLKLPLRRHALSG
jgi:hypothetical protein